MVNSKEYLKKILSAGILSTAVATTGCSLFSPPEKIGIYVMRNVSNDQKGNLTNIITYSNHTSGLSCAYEITGNLNKNPDKILETHPQETLVRITIGNSTEAITSGKGNPSFPDFVEKMYSRCTELNEEGNRLLEDRLVDLSSLERVSLWTRKPNKYGSLSSWSGI